MRSLGQIYLRLRWRARVVMFFAYFAGMTWLLLAPASFVVRWYPHFEHIDKALHFCCFGGWVLFARFAFPDPRHLGMPGWLVPVLALVYGIATEIAQGLLVQYHRSFEWADIACNGLGAAVFWFVTVWLLAESGKSTEMLKAEN